MRSSSAVIWRHRMRRTIGLPVDFAGARIPTGDIVVGDH